MAEKQAPWVSVVFMQGEEADEVFKMLYDIDGYGVTWSGPYEESIGRTVEHLKQWDYGRENEHTTYEKAPWGAEDRTVEHDDYTLAWNTHLGYLGLYRHEGPYCGLCDGEHEPRDCPSMAVIRPAEAGES